MAPQHLSGNRECPRDMVEGHDFHLRGAVRHGRLFLGNSGEHEARVQANDLDHAARNATAGIPVAGEVSIRIGANFQ
eukprot:10569894-Alexandrium_andersonii.AAC.1